MNKYVLILSCLWIWSAGLPCEVEAGQPLVTPDHGVWLVQALDYYPTDFLMGDERQPSAGSQTPAGPSRCQPYCPSNSNYGIRQPESVVNPSHTSDRPPPCRCEPTVTHSEKFAPVTPAQPIVVNSTPVPVEEIPCDQAPGSGFVIDGPEMDSPVVEGCVRNVQKSPRRRSCTK